MMATNKLKKFTVVGRDTVKKMLKVQVISDLHLDFYKDYERQCFLDSLRCVQADVTVCAGDISNHNRLDQAIEDLCTVCNKVIYVCGNHCVWQSSISKTKDKMSVLQARHPNLECLENRRIEINGQGFIGATLWYPVNKKNLTNFECFADSYYVENARHNINAAHKETIEFFSQEIKPGDIVITHHSPSTQTTQNVFLGDIMNCFFATNQEELIRKTNPKYWLFGHQHQTNQWTIGSTKLICNASGYPGEYPDFRPNLIIEV